MDNIFVATDFRRDPTELYAAPCISPDAQRLPNSTARRRRRPTRASDQVDTAAASYLLTETASTLISKDRISAKPLVMS